MVYVTAATQPATAAAFAPVEVPESLPQLAACTPVALGLCMGVVLCLLAAAALWRAGAAPDDGTIIADQAMHSAAPSGPEATVPHRSAPPLAGPSVLPPVPVEPESIPAVVKASSPGPCVDDPRVSELHRAINRCNTLFPFSRSTITVKSRPSGKTLILFGEHEARGQLGTCVARIAARTKIADGERLSFKL